MTGGIFAFLNDPVVKAEMDHRIYIVNRIAEQMGVPFDLASQRLLAFDLIESSEGQTVH